MTIIQNVACIQATINPSDKRISINKDILRGKKILEMYFLSCTVDTNIKSPYFNEYISQTEQLQNISLYANLQDINGNLFLKDFFFDHFNIDTEYSFTKKHIEYSINRVLDLDKSYISYKGKIDTEMKILIYVFYQNENFNSFTDEISGSITFKIPITAQSGYQDIKLSDIVKLSLEGKRIKQILIKNYVGHPLMGYLDLIGGKHIIENFPACYLQNQSAKQFHFDSIKIDFEKSYYRHRDAGIAYQAFITFIY
jgi:hypothetical protein